LFFGLVLLAIGLVWAGFDWPLGWFCHTDLATLRGSALELSASSQESSCGASHVRESGLE